MELIKNLKGFDETLRSVKEELRQRRDMIEKDGLTVVFNGLGEVLEIKGLEDKTLSEVRQTLIDILNQAQDITRDNVIKEISKRFGGILGF